MEFGCSSMVSSSTVKPIIFLDFDGVLNTYYWVINGTKPELIFYDDNDQKLSNFQAICWLNALYDRFYFEVVVTSQMRLKHSHSFLKNVLYQSGVNQDMSVIDVTPILEGTEMVELRRLEITKWINIHHYQGPFLIFDDKKQLGDLTCHLIPCHPSYGFGLPEYCEARKRLEQMGGPKTKHLI